MRHTTDDDGGLSDRLAAGTDFDAKIDRTFLGGVGARQQRA
jgi:hypothetical protein